MSREKTQRRVLLVGALVVAAAAFGVLAFGNIGDSLVYYWSPTELLDAGDRAYGANIRLGGFVERDSVIRGDDGLTLDFVVSDGKNTVPVHARSVPPAMFREGIGVVVEGTYGRDGQFKTNRLMVKHDNEYRAPENYDEKSVEDLLKTLQFDT